MPTTPRKSPGKAKNYTLGQGGEQLHDLTVPSGATCQVRRPGPQGLIKVGILDGLDSLTALIKTEHFDRVDGKVTTADVQELVKHPEKIQQGMDLISKVVLYCVVQPKLHPDPPGLDGCKTCLGTGEVNGQPCSRHEREAGLVYISDVEMEDQVFIMSYCMGGPRDLEAFRAGRDELLGNVPGGEGVRLPAE